MTNDLKAMFPIELEGPAVDFAYRQHVRTGGERNRGNKKALAYASPLPLYVYADSGDVGDVRVSPGHDVADNRRSNNPAVTELYLDSESALVETVLGEQLHI